MCTVKDILDSEADETLISINMVCKTILLAHTIYKGVGNLPNKFHLYLIYMGCTPKSSKGEICFYSESHYF